MTKTSAAAARRTEQVEAMTRLRELFPVGSTVHTVLRHTTTSGMTRWISVLVADQTGAISDVSHLVSRVGVGSTDNGPRDGVKMTGAGMDMGFALVYNLGVAMYGDGYSFIHRWV
jgi:hypothetical protein